MFGLNGQVALVTGGAQGIGSGIALELGLAGVRVVIANRRSSIACHTVELMRRSGLDAVSLSLDVTDSDSVRRCIESAMERFSRIDILVNNAGIFQNRLGLELSEEEFNRCLDVNLTGIWRMVQALVPIFKAQGGGKIVNISSVGGLRGVGFAPAYCASKAAVINLTQSLAAALGADNINVNAVCPGAVSTAMQEEIAALRATRGEIHGADAVLPLAGPLTAQDIGRAVVFLVSEYARSITGQALNVDCGYSLRWS